jgi:hypothetical protein
VGNIVRRRKMRNETSGDFTPQADPENGSHSFQATAELVKDYLARMDIPVRQHNLYKARFLSAVDEKREYIFQELLRDKFHHPEVKRRKWVWQLAAAVVVATLMLFPLQGQMSVAAKDSLPGDALYLVKLASEDSAVEVIEEPEVKALLTLSFADKRIDELAQLALEGREIPLTAIYRTHRLLNQAVSYTAWVEQEDMVAVLDEINQHIQSYVHNLESVRSKVGAENGNRLSDMRGRCLRLQLIVTAASLEPGVFQEAYRAGTPEQLTALSVPLGSDLTTIE